ncbi:MAG: Trk family potassium uptake protein [Clostridiales bacterium]|nr:Trk family potassium uptake protein [Clostridiales bacterium]
MGKAKKIRLKRHITTFQFTILGFTGIIFAGCFLLMLPFSSKSGCITNFWDALFTSVSAVCVTGLVVQNTVTYWSAFGQAVILLLIALGGMGVITIRAGLLILAGRKPDLVQRTAMQDNYGALKLTGIVELMSFIMKVSTAVVLLGAVCFSIDFCPRFGFSRGIWYSVFHSVSAFCNAGFDLMGSEEAYCSLTAYSGNFIVNITAMLLIIIGGLGFVSWYDIKEYGLKFRKYGMQTKVIICTSLILIFVPAVFFFIYEFGGNGAEGLLCGLFQSVTARTAGFNTADLSLFSEGSIFIMIMLMLVGGSPGSTAGGMKTTTIAVLVKSAFSVFKRKESTSFFGRRISDETVKNASATFLMYITLFVAGGIIISMAEGLPLLSCFFETASAVATVGLSLGLTPTFGLVSRLVLIFLMFVGRVGGLTLVYAAVSTKKRNLAEYPKGKITVG